MGFMGKSLDTGIDIVRGMEWECIDLWKKMIEAKDEDRREELLSLYREKKAELNKQRQWVDAMVNG